MSRDTIAAEARRPYVGFIKQTQQDLAAICALDGDAEQLRQAIRALPIMHGALALPFRSPLPDGNRDRSRA